MSDIYQITLTTQTGETFTGKMSRRQPELVNGFVPLATETGEWLYFAPADVKRVQFTPVPLLRTTSTTPTMSLTTSLLSCRRRGIHGLTSLSLVIRMGAIRNLYRECRNAYLQSL
ncbi:TPA: hypothetical protein L4W84_002779 [Enterobacter kobei]|nr:hypothetical protein [Enterobacter kobei]